jgi:hypothetical protein
MRLLVDSGGLGDQEGDASFERAALACTPEMAVQICAVVRCGKRDRTPDKQILCLD